MISVIDYGIDNVAPLLKLIEGLNISFELTSSESAILRADKIILPNTNDIELALRQLHLLNLFTMLRVCKKPILGISAGMHLMCSHIKEGGKSCLGIFPATVEKFDKINKVDDENKERKILLIKKSKLFDGLTGAENYFFDNLYYVPVDEHTSAVAGQFPIYTAAIEKDWYFGVQFLPENSGNAGISVIKNFCLMA